MDKSVEISQFKQLLCYLCSIVNKILDHVIESLLVFIYFTE